MIKKFSNNASSVIKEVAYNTEAHKMRIIFNSGSSYIYDAVPEKVFNELITSESLGKYFGMYIKDRYLYTKMNAEEFAALNKAVAEAPKDPQFTFLDYLMNLINEA